MEFSELKHLQRYTTTFELDYRKIERNPHRHQLSTTFYFTIEEVFETPEVEDVDRSTSYSMIYDIVNRNCGNNFHHQNVTNQHQHVRKPTYQQYQSIYFQRPMNF